MYSSSSGGGTVGVVGLHYLELYLGLCLFCVMNGGKPSMGVLWEVLFCLYGISSHVLGTR